MRKDHYNPALIDDAFSKGIYKDYIEALDPSKRFFLQTDIDEFSKFETQLDDQLLNKDLSFFNLSVRAFDEKNGGKQKVLQKHFELAF